MEDPSPLYYRLEPVYPDANRGGRLVTAALMQCMATGDVISNSGGGSQNILGVGAVARLREGALRDHVPALDAIREERASQLSTWSAGHDDRKENGGELVRGACAYALASIPDAAAAITAYPWQKDHVPVRDDANPARRDPMALLAKAGALIVAEMERLARLSKAESAPKP